jgi:hypothetical protein
MWAHLQTHAKKITQFIGSCLTSFDTIHFSLTENWAAVSECLWHGHASLKVIHGYGSTGGASRIRPHVLHALQKHADRHGGKVTPDGQNPGAHVLWLR